jgi:hypothetical protein
VLLSSMTRPHRHRRGPRSVGKLRLAEQGRVAGRQLADDLVQFSAGDGIGQGRQHRARVPHGGAGAGTGALGDASAELLNSESLRLPLSVARQRRTKRLGQLCGDVCRLTRRDPLGQGLKDCEQLEYVP